MFQEIIHALFGSSGSIVKFMNFSVQISNNATFLTESDKILILKISTLGNHYAFLNDFLHEKMKGNSVNLNHPKEDIISYKGMYLKAFQAGLEEILNIYQDEILLIESEYLSGTTIQINDIGVRLAPYFILLSELAKTVQSIKNKSIRGLYIIKKLEKKKSIGNPLIESAYTRILRHCYIILISQIASWSLYGIILGAKDDFFIHFTQTNNGIENSLDIQGNALTESELEQFYLRDRFSLNLQILPENQISAVLADKIFFTGKAVRILMNTSDSEAKFDLKQKLVEFGYLFENIKQLESLNVQILSYIIENIKNFLAERLHYEIVVKGNLMHHLQMLRQYLLINKGQFIDLFLDEARFILSNPPSDTSERNLNDLCWKPLFKRLNMKEGIIDESLKLYIKPSKFKISDFSKAINCNLIGNISINKNQIYVKHYGRNGYSGAIWHRQRQAIDKGFKTEFSFRFHVASNDKAKISEYGNDNSPLRNSVLDLLSPLQTLQKSQQNKSIEGSKMTTEKFKIESHFFLAFIIQNEKDVSYENLTEPDSLNKLKEYLAVTVRAPINSKAWISIVSKRLSAKMKAEIQLSQFHSNHPNASNEDIIGEVEIPNNLIDGSYHDIIIEYQNNIIKIFVENQLNPVIEQKLVISEKIKLINSSAFLGISDQSICPHSLFNMQNWTFVSFNSPLGKDCWNGLSIDYKPNWPINLIISQDAIQKYNDLFKYLLLIKRAQSELNRTWLLMYSMKKPNRGFRKIFLLRHEMKFVVNNILSYIQIDVIEKEYKELEASISKSKDYEEIRKLHEVFLRQIFHHSLLSNEKLYSFLTKLLSNCIRLCSVLERIESKLFEITDKEWTEISDIELQFTSEFKTIFREISQPKKIIEYSGISQLLMRFDFNQMYSNQQY